MANHVTPMCDSHQYRKYSLLEFDRFGSYRSKSNSLNSDIWYLFCSFAQLLLRSWNTSLFVFFAVLFARENCFWFASELSIFCLSILIKFDIFTSIPSRKQFFYVLLFQKFHSFSIPCVYETRNVNWQKKTTRKKNEKNVNRNFKDTSTLHRCALDKCL